MYVSCVRACSLCGVCVCEPQREARETKKEGEMAREWEKRRETEWEGDERDDGGVVPMDGSASVSYIFYYFIIFKKILKIYNVKRK